MKRALEIMQQVSNPPPGKIGLNIDVLVDVFHQLGWADCVLNVADEASENESLQFALTDIQYVALAAALAAVMETGGAMRINEEVQGSVDEPAATLPEPPADVVVSDAFDPFASAPETTADFVVDDVFAGLS